MRRLLIVLVVLAAVAVGGWYVYQQVWLPRQATETAPQYETITVRRDTIASTVSATGSIEPEQEVALTFRTPGYVQDVYVTEGEAVRPANSWPSWRPPT